MHISQIFPYTWIVLNAEERKYIFSWQMWSMANRAATKKSLMNFLYLSSSINNMGDQINPNTHDFYACMTSCNEKKFFLAR